MLKNLSVWNFALIERAEIDFSAGLNILTGETGAGKSILIDAVGAILGHRTSADCIRTGADWLRVEAAFEIAGRDDIHAFLIESGIVDDEDTLIVSRQITRGGRNAIRVNGCQMTLALLKTLGEYLVDIHGQHENQALLRSDSQFALVDQYGAAIRENLETYRAVYTKWRALTQKLQQKADDSREYARRLDMLRWQVDEIAAAKLKPGEDDELEAEIKVLANAEKISDLAARSHALLEDGEKGGRGVLALLSEVKRNLETIGRYDESALPIAQIAADALCQLEECGYQVRDYGEGIDYSPQRLNQLNERLSTIEKLRKKYGATIEDVLAHLQAAKTELAEIENYDEIIAALRSEIGQLETTLTQDAAYLSELRRKASEALSSEICRHLKLLGMANAQFVIEVAPLKKLGPSGADDIRMLFSANLGEDLKPMQKVASGGELSRIALAIKTVSATRDRIGVMIFDEIDSGIGGKTAQMVAERIAMVAAHKQVLCITHLPQIACMADAHLYIDKDTADGKTVTRIRLLSSSEQLSELARMASGSELTAASLDNAAEMRNHAAMKKEKWKNGKSNL